MSERSASEASCRVNVASRLTFRRKIAYCSFTGCRIKAEQNLTLDAKRLMEQRNRGSQLSPDPLTLSEVARPRSSADFHRADVARVVSSSLHLRALYPWSSNDEISVHQSAAAAISIASSASSCKASRPYILHSYSSRYTSKATRITAIHNLCRSVRPTPGSNHAISAYDAGDPKHGSCVNRYNTRASRDLSGASGSRHHGGRWECECAPCST